MTKSSPAYPQQHCKGDAPPSEYARELADTNGYREIAAAGSQRCESDLLVQVTSAGCGDRIVYNVLAPGGQPGVKVLVVVRRAGGWQTQWLQQATEYQYATGANIVVVVSRVLPPGLQYFGCLDDVWVCSESALLSLIELLRHSVLSLSGVRSCVEHLEPEQREPGQREPVQQESVQAAAYQYLTGASYQRRLNLMVESCIQLRDELEKEKSTRPQLWLKLEMRLHSLFGSIDGLHSDLREIIGMALRVIDGLDNLEDLDSVTPGSKRSSDN